MKQTTNKTHKSIYSKMRLLLCGLISIAACSAMATSWCYYVAAVGSSGDPTASCPEGGCNKIMPNDGSSPTCYSCATTSMFWAWCSPGNEVFVPASHETADCISHWYGYTCDSFSVDDPNISYPCYTTIGEWDSGCF